MQRCPHEGPHYRSVPKGQIGPWLCKECLVQTEHEPDPEVVRLAETLQPRPDASERERVPTNVESVLGCETCRKYPPGGGCMEHAGLVREFAARLHAALAELADRNLANTQLAEQAQKMFDERRWACEDRDAALARVVELEAIQAKLLRLPETEQEVEALEDGKRAERVLELLCAITNHEVVTVKVETLREIHAELSRLREELDDLKSLALEVGCPAFDGNIVDAVSSWFSGEIERLRAIERADTDLVDTVARLRAGLREIMAFHIEARFDAKASYTDRKAKEWRALREIARRLLGEEK